MEETIEIVTTRKYTVEDIRALFNLRSQDSLTIKAHKYMKPLSSTQLDEDDVVIEIQIRDPHTPEKKA